MMNYPETVTTSNRGKIVPRETLLDRILSPAPVFTLHDRADLERESVEHFVAERFQKDYGAQIHEFLPLLLSMRCMNGFSGVIGMRRAASVPLFLEQYLNKPVETAIKESTGEEISRQDIVEIGNLVASRKGPSQFVFLIFTSVLYQAGYKWISFTATQTLANNLNKLGFPMVKLADASSDSLSSDEADEWGSYYDTSPQVFAGNLEGAMAIARKRPLFRKALVLYRREIGQLARELNR